MVAQIDARILITAVIAVFVTIIGLIYWIIRSRDKLVFKDVCQANRDCIETKIDGLKELIELRFDTIEELIKNERR